MRSISTGGRVKHILYAGLGIKLLKCIVIREYETEALTRILHVVLCFQRDVFE